jgi:alanine racemase
MNNIMISLEGQDLSVGDKLIVISNNSEDKNSVQQICKDHDLFNYSLVTCLSESTRRVITT